MMRQGFDLKMEGRHVFEERAATKSSGSVPISAQCSRRSV
jgi:hypothetical protein